MHYGSGQFYMSHSLAAHTVICNLNSAAVADNAAELRAAALVLSAGAFIAPCGAKNTLAEKTVFFRTKGSVIYCFRLLYFSAGEFSYPLRRGKPHSYSGDFMICVSH